MDLSMPEILDPIADLDFEDARARASEAAAQAQDKVEELYESGAIRDAGSIAVPAFVLGLVGGAVGARILKGTVGLAIGGAAAYWAWTALKSPAPKKMIDPPQQGPHTIAPPPRKTVSGYPY